MAVERRVAVTTHGHYLLEPPEEGTPKGLLVGFHGYGETAADHLRALQEIPGQERWCKVALQGLHLFYRQRTGEVVASWMTSFDREQAIEDNVAYVRRVVAGLRASYRSIPVVLAGFSQGVAMVYRAAARIGAPMAGVIALAGDVPPDLSSEEIAALPPILLGRGTEDKWYNEAKMEADLQRLDPVSSGVPSCVFDGGHEWSPEFRQAAGKFLSSVASG